MDKAGDIYQKRIDALTQAQQRAQAALEGQHADIDMGVLHLLGALLVDRLYELNMRKSGWNG